MMTNVFWLKRKTGYSLLLLAISGLSILPFASFKYCNTVIGKFFRRSRGILPILENCSKFLLSTKN